MASANGMNILQIARVCPSESANELSLPLTYFDIPWINFHPVERLFFYQHSGVSSLLFLDSILPALQRSLSTTLSHFLPLAGNLVWPLDSIKPIIRFIPGDSMSLTVAESTDPASFDSLSADAAHKAVDSRPLVPQLSVSDEQASVMALQVTLFPNKGFCIGITSHHAALDGMSSTMFIKAWACICRKREEESEDSATLTPELTPIFNRDVIKDPTGFDKQFLNLRIEMVNAMPGSNPRSLKLMDDPKYSENLLQASFKMTKEDINNLRNKLLVVQQKSTKDRTLHLSTFVVACAYILVCLLKATESEDKKRYYFGFATDLRARLNPPVPKTYLGNCVGLGGLLSIEDRDLLDEDGMISLVEKLSDAIKEVDEKASGHADWWISKVKAIPKGPEVRAIGVAGSPRFEVYGIDFGWGKPKKVEIASIDRDGSIGLADNRDERGGIEVGLVMDKEEMEIFDALFHLGLKMSSLEARV